MHIVLEHGFLQEDKNWEKTPQKIIPYFSYIKIPTHQHEAVGAFVYCLFIALVIPPFWP